MRGMDAITEGRLERIERKLGELEKKMWDLGREIDRRWEAEITSEIRGQLAELTGRPNVLERTHEALRSRVPDALP